MNNIIVTVDDIMDILENAMNDVPKDDETFNKVKYKLCRRFRKVLELVPEQYTQLSARTSARIYKQCIANTPLPAQQISVEKVPNQVPQVSGGSFMGLCDNRLSVSTLLPMNIRIIGSYEEPWFYADDVAKMLGITKLQKLQKLGNNVRVTDEQKKKMGIIPQRMRNGRLEKCSSIVLITEHGLFVYLYKSHKPMAKMIAKNLSRFIGTFRIKLIEEARLRGDPLPFAIEINNPRPPRLIKEKGAPKSLKKTGKRNINLLKSEKECRGIISILASTSVKTYHFNKIRYDMGGLRKYELDCYDEVILENGTLIRIALEYDGIQHRAICIFAPTQEILDKQIARDLYKNDWCCTNGIYLLRVNDLVPQKQRFEVIREFLVDLNVPINNITKEQVLEIQQQALMEATGEIEKEVV